MFKQASSISPLHTPTFPILNLQLIRSVLTAPGSHTVHASFSLDSFGCCRELALLFPSVVPLHTLRLADLPLSSSVDTQPIEFCRMGSNR